MQQELLFTPRAEEELELRAEEIDLRMQGFTRDEITSLKYLRTQYMRGLSDRYEVIRHFEFVKQLIAKGILSEQ